MELTQEQRAAGFALVEAHFAGTAPKLPKTPESEAIRAAALELIDSREHNNN